MTYPARPAKNFTQRGVPLDVSTQLDTASLIPSGIMFCYHCDKASMGQFTTAGWVRDLCPQHAQQIVTAMRMLGQQIRMSMRYKYNKVDAIKNGIPIAYMVPVETGALSVNNEETLEIWEENHHTPNYENAAPINESSYDGGKALQFRAPRGLPAARRKARSEGGNGSETGPVTGADGSLTGQIVGGTTGRVSGGKRRADGQQAELSGPVTYPIQVTGGQYSASVSQEVDRVTGLQSKYEAFQDRLKNPPQICECGCEEEITSGDVRQKYINNAHKQRAFKARAKKAKKEEAQSFARRQDVANTRKEKKEERKGETSVARKYFK